jgi:hypothetical protein
MHAEEIERCGDLRGVEAGVEIARAGARPPIDEADGDEMPCIAFADRTSERLDPAPGDFLAGTIRLVDPDALHVAVASLDQPKGGPSQSAAVPRPTGATGSFMRS